jgi:hypothetical protein
MLTKLGNIKKNLKAKRTLFTSAQNNYFGAAVRT